MRQILIGSYLDGHRILEGVCQTDDPISIGGESGTPGLGPSSLAHKDVETPIHPGLAAHEVGSTQCRKLLLLK